MTAQKLLQGIPRKPEPSKAARAEAERRAKETFTQYLARLHAEQN